jgi:hypothetical protein
MVETTMKKKKKYTFNELMTIQVVTPDFRPKFEDYVKALLFWEDYWEGRRRFIVTSKPYLWALALQTIARTVVISGIPRFEGLSPETSQEILEKAKEIQQKRQQKRKLQLW